MSISLFCWCRYFSGPWVSFVTTDEFLVRVTKITSKIGVSWTHSLPFYFQPISTKWIMIILSKECKLDKFELRNPLKLSFTNIWDLWSNFADLKFSLESNSPDILALCEKNLDVSNDSGNFSVKYCLPLIWKDSSTHMHGLAVHVKEGIAFALELSLENSADSYLRFWLALLHSLSYFFFLYG